MPCLKKSGKTNRRQAAGCGHLSLEEYHGLPFLSTQTPDIPERVSSILDLDCPEDLYPSFSVIGFHFDPPVGTEELGHLEMIGALVHQLTRNLSEDQIKECGFAPYFVDHTTGVYPTAASGFPWSAASIQVSGDTIADLTEDLAAEQKARKTYDNILRLSDDPDVNDVIKFLRQREIVHFQRFGEGLRLAKEKMNQKNVYLVNPSFDQ